MHVRHVRRRFRHGRFGGAVGSEEALSWGTRRSPLSTPMVSANFPRFSSMFEAETASVARVDERSLGRDLRKRCRLTFERRRPRDAHAFLRPGFSMLDKYSADRIGPLARRVADLATQVFDLGRAPFGLMAVLFVLDVGVYLADIWSTALIAVRQLLFVVVVLAGATRNLWATIFFVLLSTFLHVQAFREYVPHPEDFTDLHYVVNFLIAIIPYALAGFLGAFFVAFVVGPDESANASKERPCGVQNGKRSAG